jgi:hypothetical protein
VHFETEVDEGKEEVVLRGGFGAQVFQAESLSRRIEALSREIGD